MKIEKVTYLIQCNCGCQFSVVRTDNNMVLFECPDCQKQIQAQFYYRTKPGGYTIWDGKHIKDKKNTNEI